jgi:RHS repeat-associated protein
MPTVTTTYVIGNGNNGAGANQIASETTSGVTTTYAYDGNGNRTGRTISGTTDVFSYDYENRLTSLDYLTGSSGTGMYTYTYDYRTRRVSRTEPGASTTYIVFDGGTSIEEYNSSPSSPTVEYIRGFNYGGGVGGLEYSIRSGVSSFNFFDSRGDVVAKTNSSGAITWETAYEAFGNQTASTGTTPADRQRASTKEQDPTGFLNEGFRYRDLSTGTFLTRDPLGFKAGLNNYTYVRQNPWTKFDPEGLDESESSKHPKPPPKQKTKQANQKKPTNTKKPSNQKKKQKDQNKPSGPNAPVAGKADNSKKSPAPSARSSNSTTGNAPNTASLIGAGLYNFGAMVGADIGYGMANGFKASIDTFQVLASADVPGTEWEETAEKIQEGGGPGLDSGEDSLSDAFSEMAQANLEAANRFHDNAINDFSQAMGSINRNSPVSATPSSSGTFASPSNISTGNSPITGQPIYGAITPFDTQRP